MYNVVMILNRRRRKRRECSTKNVHENTGNIE